MKFLSIQIGVFSGLLAASFVCPDAAAQDAKSKLKESGVSAMGSPVPSPSASQSPTESEKRLIDAEKTALQTAANKLCEQIQVEENDVYHRLSFFQKPTRLDPHSYASVDEINQWRSLLKDLKDRGDRVAGLYHDLSKNFDVELKNSKVPVDPRVASQFKTILLGLFPWETINKKSSLFDEYVEAHRKLLDFYQQNWDAWQPAGKDVKPVFKTTALTTAYNRLREEITSTGRQLNDQYTAMTN
jgi:hypothetical protein